MESLTYFKNLKSTPRKFRSVAHDVRKLTPVAAVSALEKQNKKAARGLAKVINSAITNAKQTLKVTEDMLEFKLFTIEEGQKLKRFRPGSRGMAKAFYRRFSHIKIILTAKEAEKKAEPVAKPTKKAEEKIEKKAPVKAEAKAEKTAKAAPKKAESKEKEVTNTK
jgi:large subunit ribosomal protein L22